ncbi:hypothetical protein [Formosa sp. PL04]|uniref:hypothetical protein n=1 Tax=Formosa sp. PL04 TaxID=3081755 RepID=UPI0029822E07|nr:hypothetical protein [Formosa sp. PL04]MDW5287657.1 hypothetical protein [Formosa sp. PL04]
MPGIFYLYYVEGEKSYLKAWNDNYVTVTGCRDDEMMNKDATDFVDEASISSIKEGITALVLNGSVKNVYGNILSKSGDITPYVFEGVRFSVEKGVYFMGLGLDVSDLLSAKEQIKMLEFQKHQKEKKLFSVAIQEQKKEELLQNVLFKLETLENNVSNRSNAIAIKSLRKEINNHFSFNDNWQVFKKMFGEIHFHFFRDLEECHPDLTKGESQYCAYIKIQMHASEICNIMNISKESLAKKRYRLKKKLGLSKEQKLDRYISAF